MRESEMQICKFKISIREVMGVSVKDVRKDKG